MILLFSICSLEVKLFVIFLSFSDCYYASNIVFALDSSTFIGSDGFGKSKDFAKSVAEYFDPKVTNLALVDFDQTARTRIPFKRERKLDEFKRLIDSLKYNRGSGHSINTAFETAGALFRGVSASAGAKIFVLVTATQPNTVAQEAGILLRKTLLETSGTRIYAVGAGNGITLEFLRKVAPDTKSSFRVDNFDDIIGVVQTIRKSMCRTARINPFARRIAV